MTKLFSICYNRKKNKSENNMFLKKTALVTTILLSFVALSACSSKNKVTDIKTNPSAQTFKTKNEDVRIKFNQIHVANVSSEFKDGTTLEELKNLYGEPTGHEDIPAGDVTVNSYSWNSEGVSINAQLYENSTIGKAISNFSFIRKDTIDKKMYDGLNNGTSYEEIVSLLGEPDDYSQASSSEKEELRAIWGTGIKTKNRGATITLVFENGKLTSKNSSGLTNK